MEISKTGNEPIYIRVVNNFKKQILSGILKADDKMPSVRELALNLTVNPNTIQKAYQELERDGYIYVVPGKGNFVSGKITKVKNQAIKDEIITLRNITEKLYELGVSEKEIIDEIKKIGGKLK